MTRDDKSKDDDMAQAHERLRAIGMGLSLIFDRLSGLLDGSGRQSADHQPSSSASKQSTHHDPIKVEHEVTIQSLEDVISDRQKTTKRTKED